MPGQFLWELNANTIALPSKSLEAFTKFFCGREVMQLSDVLTVGLLLYLMNREKMRKSAIFRKNLMVGQ